MSTSEYISHDDESEAARIQDLRGVGEPIFDQDEVIQYAMHELGFGLNNDRT